jgi:hypothetical protein
LLASLITPGCQFVFGTYEVGIDGSTDAGASSGGASSSTQPIGGAPQGGATGTGGVTAAGGATDWGNCDGQQLYTCKDATILKCVSGKWTWNDACEKVSYCNVTTGHCDKCALNDHQCATTSGGDSAVFVCADPQVGFTLETTCKTPLYCANDVKSCVVCERDETRCVTDDAGALSHAARCLDNRSGWYDVPCAGGCKAIDGKKDDCPDCINGSTACQKLTSGKWMLRTCVAGGWTGVPCAGECLEPTATAPAACQ